MNALFLRDFDAENEHLDGVNDTSVPEVQMFSFTEDELGKMLAEAREQGAEQGRTEGFEDGKRTAHQEQIALTGSALTEIRDHLAQFLSQDTQRRQELENDLVDMVLDICERVVPDLLKTYSVDQVHARLKGAIHMGAGKGKLTLRLSTETEATLAPDLGALIQAEYAETATIIADPTLKNGETRMSWDNGFMNYSLDAVCAELLDALRSASEQLKPQTQKV